MQERDEAWKSIVAGAIAGLAASWVMNRYQGVQSKAVARIKRSTQSEGERAVDAGREAALGRERQKSSNAQENETQQKEDQRPSTVKLAEVISIAVARHRLTERQQRIAEPIVHYAFGTLMGAWYGVLSAVTPLTTAGRGTLYGAAVWVGADEISLAALGLAKSPLEYPVSSHLSALSAHLVYGFSLDVGHRALLKIMGVEQHDSAERLDSTSIRDILAGEDWPSFRRGARAMQKRARQVQKRARDVYGEVRKRVA